MKKLSLLILPFFFLTIYGAEEPTKMFTMSGDPDTDYWFNQDLKADVPVQKNTSQTSITLVSATGSIGAKTFSLLPHLESITIAASTIDNIEDGAFCALPKLAYITIDNNVKFPDLTESIFRNCDKLKGLVVTNTKIESKALNSMVNLGSITFKGLKGFRLTKEHLQSSKNLETLIIQDSEIEDIEAGSLCSSPKLKYLYLNDNKALPTLTKSMFENCNNVKGLRFLQNSDLNFEVEAFSGFTNVKSVSIDHANVSHLKKGHLVGLSTTEYLWLGYAKISKIDVDAFEGFENLKELILCHNELTELNPDVISSLPNLKRLALWDNQLISADNLRHSTLSNLDVSSNQISKIDTKVLKEHLPNLKSFRITKNALSKEDEDIVKKELPEVRVSVD